MRVSIPEAKKIKHYYGCVAGFLLDEEERQELIEITPVGRQETRSFQRKFCAILCSRAQSNFFSILRTKLAHRRTDFERCGFDRRRFAYQGMVEIAEQVFDAPTRLGFLDGNTSADWLMKCKIPNGRWPADCFGFNALANAADTYEWRKSPTRKVADGLKIFVKNLDKCNIWTGFFTANRCMLFRHRHNILLKSSKNIPRNFIRRF